MARDPKRSKVVVWVQIVGAVLALMWIVWALDAMLLGGALRAHGIRPRTLRGLWGIPAMPFLHAGFDHVAANSIPFAVLGFAVATRGTRVWVLVTVLIVCLSGAGIWLLGRSAVHIGASGLVFGYLGFLLAAGFVERSLLSIAIMLCVGALYGGLLWGVLPSSPVISWEGHLFGLVGGMASARMVLRSPSTTS